MKKRLLLIYIIGSILATIALFMSTNGALLGSFFSWELFIAFAHLLYSTLSSFIYYIRWSLKIY